MKDVSIENSHVEHMTEGSHLLITLLRNLEELIAKTIESGTKRHLHDRKIKLSQFLHHYSQ